MELILASGSPRRKELLGRITSDFKVVVSDVDETVDETLPGSEIVAILAKRKAEAVVKDYPNALVLGSDTIVYLNGKVLGKPKDKAEATKMLQALSGTTHHVYTAVYLTNGHITDTQISDTKVTLHHLTDEEIADYVASEEPMDKAGAYGIQGLGALLVAEIQGDFYGVAGFPIATVYRMLKKQSFLFE